MKIKKIQELRAKKTNELEGLINKAESELVKLKMEKAGSKPKNTAAVRKKRREIAVMKTLVREKQLQQKEEKSRA